MSETLGEYLTKSTIGISPEQFRHSRDQLGGHASWAIWGENTYDLDGFKEANEPWTKVRNNVFLLGGNTGLFRDGTLTTFSNFHTEDHRGDTKLRNAITGTALEGAYLSDIVKDCPTTDSGALITRMKAEIAQNESFLNEKVFEPLEQERTLLGSPAGLVLVLLGKGTSNVWDYVSTHPSAPEGLLDGLRVISGINHYTSAGDYHVQMELALNSLV